MFVTTTDGVDLWWEQLGNGPTVLLIPGRGDSTDLFPKLLIDRLVGAGASVLRMDPRDTGLSGDGGDEYTLSTFADDIVAVLDAAAVSRVHTVAVSMGGMITVDLVSRFGHRVMSSTFIAAMSPDPDDGMGPDFCTSLGTTDRTLVLMGMMGMPDESDRDWMKEESRLAAERAAERPEAAERHMAASFRFGWPTLDQLGDFVSPALVVHGTSDRLLPITHGQALASGIEGSSLHLVNGMGHLPTRREWEQVAELVTRRILG